ncbi:hypothetical protein [Streptosporangium lutulentum]|uniref:hypothetical protein n=1 Tax=Streptosporangium lutulentum TaxID=1461250 RepID=UPI00351FEFD0
MREITERYLGGDSSEEIAGSLNRRGVRPVRDGRRDSARRGFGSLLPPWMLTAG